MIFSYYKHTINDHINTVKYDNTNKAVFSKPNFKLFLKKESLYSF